MNGVPVFDSKRNWHPDRIARLKAAPPAPHAEMQSLMRQVHQDRDLRAEVVRRARKCMSPTR
jgi:hypothetical protein